MFAFSGILYPHPQQFSLRSICLYRHEYGLTVCRIGKNGRLGVDYFPVIISRAQDRPLNEGKGARVVKSSVLSSGVALGECAKV